ncbi:hypothetical protein Hanom_Chr16g01503431 [Helianthus anomalus]
MSKAGFDKVVYQYVGGFNLLLVFEDEVSAGDFTHRNKDWQKWFSHADIWVGQGVAYERVAWLRVLGVPIHLYYDEVFNEICCRYGVVTKLPLSSEEDGDLSMGCVGVLVGECKRIIDEVTISWQDKKYRVWVSEDLGDWIPDCLDEDEDSGEDEVSEPGSELRSSEIQVDQEKEEDAGGSNPIGQVGDTQELEEAGEAHAPSSPIPMQEEGE